MKFEVYKGSITYMSTEYPSCIPYNNLRSMQGSGYKFRLNGKAATVSEILKIKDTVTKAEWGAVDIDEPLNNANNVSEEETDAVEEPKKQATSKKSRQVKKVYCKETDTTYDSMSAAGRALSLDPAAVSYAVQVGRPTKGYTFTLVES